MRKHSKRHWTSLIVALVSALNAPLADADTTPAHLFDAKLILLPSRAQAVAQFERLRTNNDLRAAALVLQTALDTNRAAPDTTILAAGAAITWMESGHPEQASPLWHLALTAACTTHNASCSAALALAAQYAVTAALWTFDYPEASYACRSLVAQSLPAQSRLSVLDTCVGLLTDDAPVFATAYHELGALQTLPNAEWVKARFLEQMLAHPGQLGDPSRELEDLIAHHRDTAVGFHAAFLRAAVGNGLIWYRKALSIARSEPSDRRRWGESVKREHLIASVAVADDDAQLVIESFIKSAQRINTKPGTWRTLIDFIETSMTVIESAIVHAYDMISTTPYERVVADIRRGAALRRLSARLTPLSLSCPAIGQPSGSLWDSCVARHMIVGGHASRRGRDLCDTNSLAALMGGEALIGLTPSWSLECDAQSHLPVVNPVLATDYRP